MNGIRLGPLLRYVDDTSATIWVETHVAATVSVLDESTNTFTVEGRHYALVILEGLEPGTVTEYSVAVDGVVAWPEPESDFPASVIRTTGGGRPVAVLVGSCRAAAPHEPPFTLELALDNEARGIDSLWTHAQRMAREPVEEWPDLLLLLGDQIYADDSSPQTRERIETLRGPDSELPIELVASYEEYSWLYQEAWSLPAERWILSVVPSAMIFDDHDMIDDWNISASWVADIRTESWWKRHAIGGIMSYWVYQHLGNLSPERIRQERMLDQLIEADDGTEVLRSWAEVAVRPTGTEPSEYQFSHARDVGDVRVIVIDCRTARILDPGHRLMVNDAEWAWVSRQAMETPKHLIVGTSLPVFIPDGMHDLQVWNERVCDGAWGRWAVGFGERVRRRFDLEDWSAFGRSYARFVDLMRELRDREGPLESIVIASGDIHFSYAARVPIVGDGTPPVWQVVSSPIRNALIPPERGAMRTMLTRTGRVFGDLLRRSARAPSTRPGLQLAAGPFFANNMGELKYEPEGVRLVIEQATPDDDGGPQLREVAELDLYA